MDEEKIRAALHEENDEFRRLEEKHHKYAEKLDAIADKAFLSPEEVVRKNELKKRKLQIKDQMHDMIVEYHKGIE